MKLSAGVLADETALCKRTTGDVTKAESSTTDALYLLSTMAAVHVSNVISITGNYMAGNILRADFFSTFPIKVALIFAPLLLVSLHSFI